MIETPQVLETAQQLTAYIPLVVEVAEIRNVMGPGVNEIFQAIAAQGILATGPWFTHHRRMDPKVFDFEICVPVCTPVAPSGRVLPGSWPAMRVARTLYQGRFEGLPGAWKEFDAWVAQQKLEPGPDLWERYLAGPETGLDPAQWRTELNRPIL